MLTDSRNYCNDLFLLREVGKRLQWGLEDENSILKLKSIKFKDIFLESF